LKPGVRVTGGFYRGRSLAVPPGARPTEGRVREALFSMWSDRLEGARVLDLFAGSGVVALEAAGRGALNVLAVDEGLRAVKHLEDVVRRLGESLIDIRRLSLPQGIDRLAVESAGPFDLVYADPPYDFAFYEAVLSALLPLLAADAEVVVEHSSRRSLPLEVDGLVRVDSRRYGETTLTFYRQAPR
jgi:16S rRNA (guanine966-N2)-methyltransferase